MEQGSVAALERLEQLSEDENKPPGLPYLKARLLEAEGRLETAESGFREAMVPSSSLEPWARYRLALLKENTGHPAVAAGLAAGLLGDRPPKALLEPAADLLHRSLSIDGDCRVLKGLSEPRFKSRVKRRLGLAKAACFRRVGETPREKALLKELLAEDPADDSAHFAAVRLETLIKAKETPTDPLIDIGTAFFHHRDFALSVELLSQALSRPDTTLAAEGRVPSPRILDSHYALARSHFWLGQYQKAAVLFGKVADASPKKSFAAKALYQRARCFELAGSSLRSQSSTDSSNEKKTGHQHWRKAIEAFAKVSTLDPNSGWASAAMIGRMRLHYLIGETENAQKALAWLEKKGSADNFARASLFLAISEIVQGRTQGVGPALKRLQRIDRLPDYEIELWLGRYAELEGRARDAVDHYLNTLSADPFHPFAEVARKRLQGKALQAAVEEATDWLAAGPDSAGLYKAWLLLGDSDPRGAAAMKALKRRLEPSTKAAPYLHMSVKPTEAWPLWATATDRPEDLLLKLGLFEEPGTSVLRHFPVADPSDAFTGSTALARRGATKRSLYIAEVLLKRMPDELPIEALPDTYHQLLYPFRYSYLVMRESRKQGIDPFLLSGLIREESRFDAQAFSAASARGLTQFIYPTARQIAERIELGPIAPWDIHRPEIAIALGAGYLKQLIAELDGNLSAAVAAYNAGEPQAELWRHYCRSEDPEELWSKIAFRETRSYVRKVLTSRNHYRSLYGKDSEPVTPPPVASAVSDDADGV